MDAATSASGKGVAQSGMRDEVAKAVHDLRGGLNAVLLWAELLKVGRVPAGQLSEAYEAIHSNAEAMRRHLEGLSVWTQDAR
jgi:signal transduction histidine kinase